MNTELDLQEAIKKVLEKEIAPKISIFKPGELQIHLQDIPLSTEYEKPAEFDIDTDFDDEADYDTEIDKHIPCCIVKLRGAEEKTANDPQITTVEIVVIIKDWSKDMSGYKSLLICIQRIRDYFLSQAGIKNKFRMVYPVKWVINEEAAIPYFVGSITTRWVTPTMPPCDPFEKYL